MQYVGNCLADLDKREFVVKYSGSNGLVKEMLYLTSSVHCVSWTEQGMLPLEVSSHRKQRWYAKWAGPIIRATDVKTVHWQNFASNLCQPLTMAKTEFNLVSVLFGPHLDIPNVKTQEGSMWRVKMKLVFVARCKFPAELSHSKNWGRPNWETESSQIWFLDLECSSAWRPQTDLLDLKRRQWCDWEEQRTFKSLVFQSVLDLSFCEPLSPDLSG